jgi:hypothetical protein
MKRIVVIFALAVSSGCLSSSTDAQPAPLVVDDGCQPLLASDAHDDSSPGFCLAPYPSDFYHTGDHIELHGNAAPLQANGKRSDPHLVFHAQGFSPVSTIVASLPGDVVHDGLASPLDDPGMSTSPQSPSILLDTVTGERVPHYVDVYDNVPDGARRPIVIRPITQLAPLRRYVVALAGMHVDGGAIAPPAEGFRRLRDSIADPALAPLARYENDVFAPLAKAGVARASLQLAWDFTTGTPDEPTRDMFAVREATLKWLETNAPTVTIASAADATDRLAKIIKGSVTAPLYLDSAAPGGHLSRDASGAIVQNGNTTFDFEATIPTSLATATTPGRIVCYGHGFFGDVDELEGNGARTIADKLGAILISTRWWGMSHVDFGVVANNLTQAPEHVTDFNEPVHQAMANWLVLVAAIKGPLAKAPELHRANGDPLYDPTFISYFGASQGHILGGTLTTLVPDFTRVVLNVGGGGFTHMMPRSGDFGAFSLVAESVYTDPLVLQSYFAMLQRGLDRIDPISYASSMKATVLMQTGLGDAQVPNVASFLHARALGVKQLMPAPMPIPLLEPTQGGQPGSSVTLFDFHIDTTPSAMPFPLAPNEVHEGVRINPAALRQMDAFLRPDGIIQQTCDGPCDPE